MSCISKALALVLIVLLAGCAGAPPRQPQPDQAAAQYRQALAAMEAGRAGAAMDLFLQMSRDYPALAGPHANLGLLYQQQGRMPEAAAAFDRALALQPQSGEIYNAAAVFYRSAGRFEDAEAAYLKAIEHSPELAEPVLNLAILYDLYLNRPAAALPYYRRYLSMTGGGGGRVAQWLAELQRRLE